MSKNIGIFDIKSSEDFFYSIKNVFEKYKKNKEKSIESLLYIIMGLNHLREWIAPGYKYNEIPTNPAEVFYNSIYDEYSFKIINILCNKTKHLIIYIETSSSHDLPFDEWNDIDSVRDFDNGPATGYFVDDKNIIEIIKEVIEFYQMNWFDKNAK